MLCAYSAELRMNLTAICFLGAITVQRWWYCCLSGWESLYALSSSPACLGESRGGECCLDFKNMFVSLQLWLLPIVSGLLETRCFGMILSWLVIKCIEMLGACILVGWVKFCLKRSVLRIDCGLWICIHSCVCLLVLGRIQPSRFIPSKGLA